MYRRTRLTSALIAFVTSSVHSFKPSCSSSWSPDEIPVWLHLHAVRTPLVRRHRLMVGEGSDWPRRLSLTANDGCDWPTCPDLSEADWLILVRLAAEMTGEWCWCCDNGSHPDEQHLDRVCLKDTAAGTTSPLTGSGREVQPGEKTQGGRKLQLRLWEGELTPGNKLTCPGGPVGCCVGGGEGRGGGGGGGAALKYDTSAAKL